MDRLKRVLDRWPFTPLAPRPTGLAPAGGLPSPPQAILFDVYGTLLVSSAGDISTNAGVGRKAADPPRRSALAELEQAPAGIAGRLKDLIAAWHASQRRAGIDVPEVRIDRIWMTLLAGQSRRQAREAALIWELTVNPVWPMPGASAVLDTARRAGLVLGLVSNAQFFTPLILEHLFKGSLEALGFAPRLRIFSYRLGRAKPSPVLFTTAAQALAELGIQPAATLYVGNDMLNDVWAATRAGFQTALFAGDARSLRLRRDDGRCAGLTPDLVITDLTQLPNHFPAIAEDSGP